MSDLRFPANHSPPAPLGGRRPDEFDGVPTGFGEALRLGAADLEIPRRVDDAVMNAARLRLAAVRRASVRRSAGRWTLRRAAACAAVAASLALAAVLAMPRQRAGDINRDGSVDILDAMRLARGIEVSGSLRDGNDLTGDGVVDQRDVQWIAQHVVRLPEEAG